MCNPIILLLENTHLSHLPGIDGGKTPQTTLTLTIVTFDLHPRDLDIGPYFRSLHPMVQLAECKQTQTDRQMDASENIISSANGGR